MLTTIAVLLFFQTIWASTEKILSFVMTIYFSQLVADYERLFVMVASDGLLTAYKYADGRELMKISSKYM